MSKMIYIDIQMFTVDDVMSFFTDTICDYIFIMVYSYRKSIKINNNDIINIQSYKEILLSVYKNSIVLNHIGKDYTEFLIHKFIVDDIEYYKPNYLYVISKFNINIEKLLERSKCNLERSYLVKKNSS